MEGVQLQTMQAAPIPNVLETSEELSQEGAPSLQQQIENVRSAMLSRSEGAVYSADELETFCEQNGGPTVFKAWMAMMTPVRIQRKSDKKEDDDNMP